MKFKVGDKVRTTVQSFGIAQFTKGVVIEAGRESRFPYAVLFDGQSTAMPAYSSEIELQPEEVSPTFKVGDRVAVAFEDVITEVIEGIAYFSNRSSAAPVTVLTKLTNPIPTTNGAVIRLNWVMADIFENIGSQWFKTGTDKMYTPGQVQGMANRHGFIVLYEGS